jgi:uncharacterized protein YjiS (DUF1127 family)
MTKDPTSSGEAPVRHLYQARNCAMHKTNFPANCRIEDERRLKMTMIGLNRETTRNFGSNNRVGVMSNIKTFLNRSQAERQLRQLDDRLLADIGLKRADISKSVWGR